MRAPRNDSGSMRGAAAVARRALGIWAVALLAASVLYGTSRADDPWEFWPEFNAFVRLNPRTRLHFVTAYAQGKESYNRTVDMAGYVDVAFMPILRPLRKQEDWARNRYLWARIGYDHVFEAEGRVHSPTEDRGIVALYAKSGLPGDVWLEGRAREDLRWLDGGFSTRYRLRGEATREFALRKHAVTPYLNVEWFYDNRFDDWSRVLSTGGTEVTVNPHFRFEVYLARQVDQHPTESALNALGVLAKVYY